MGTNLKAKRGRRSGYKKNLQWFNLSLLAKWRWRLLKEEKRLLREVVVSRYGQGVGEVSLSLGGRLVKKTSN